MTPNARYMLVSKERQSYVKIDGNKVGKGQFFTTNSTWMFPQVAEFIRESKPESVIDPFVGQGDLLDHVNEIIPQAVKFGYDIEPIGEAISNDSLVRIPRHAQSVIVTNPPYLAKHSAKRKRVWEDSAKYYAMGRNDLYQVALDRCLESCDRVVAIVPETFLNSSYPKNHLRHVTIAEHDLFHDTDCPVCIVCFDNKQKKLSEIPIYRDEEKLGTLQDFEDVRMRPQKTIKIQFNDPAGAIALRAVDLQDIKKPIRFMRRDEIGYPVEMIKVSSRLVTFLSIPSITEEQVPSVILAANRILEEYRTETCDVVLSPFKGNRKDGRRRRRLDYRTARALLEKAVCSTLGEPNCESNLFAEVSV
jgi:Eco57I restriction-modification methylase